MQQKPSKTYQRIRKLSDSIVCWTLQKRHYTNDPLRATPSDAENLHGRYRQAAATPCIHHGGVANQGRPRTKGSSKTRARERQVFHAANTAKRPERPPKAKASVPIHHSQAQQQVQVSAPASQRVTSLKAEIVQPRERSHAEGSRSREPTKDTSRRSSGALGTRRLL
ncbi:hypothetical protein FKP32DRAFT_1422523 [Trametes sanguinea]|nr:hypothetical protein FKP32DRAFT_1422523 [Trametes sanguinea]